MSPQKFWLQVSIHAALTGHWCCSCIVTDCQPCGPDSDRAGFASLSCSRPPWLHLCLSAHIKVFKLIRSAASLCTTKGLRSPAEGSPGTSESLTLCQIGYLVAPERASVWRIMTNALCIMLNVCVKPSLASFYIAYLLLSGMHSTLLYPLSIPGLL